MQGWFALNQVIQVTDQLLDAAMRVVLQQIPTDLAVVVPFVPLGSSLPMNSSFLPGCVHM